jgi:hypothetical protein
VTRSVRVFQNTNHSAWLHHWQSSSTLPKVGGIGVSLSTVPFVFVLSHQIETQIIGSRCTMAKQLDAAEGG